MKTNEKTTMGLIYRDCAKAMAIPCILLTISSALTGTVYVLTANTLGGFADAAFRLDLPIGLQNAMLLIGCILFTVVVSPAIGLFGNFSMLIHALRHDKVVFARYLDKDPEKAAALDAGEMQYQLEDAPLTLRLQWVNLLTKACALPFTLGYLLYSAGRISWLLTALMLFLAAARLITPILLKTRLAKYDKHTQEYNAKRRSYESDITNKPHIIKLWGIQKPICQRVHQLYTTYFAEMGSGAITVQVLSEQCQKLINGLTQLLLFLSGAVMVAEGHVSPGEFTAMLVYLSVAQTILGNIGDIIQNIPIMKNAASRVYEFYQDTEPDSGTSIDSFCAMEGEGISFSYGEKQVLRDFTFSIGAGEKICICGRNGSGKSTFSKIINTTLKSYQGMIKINGMDFKKVKLESWRNVIAYAPQTPYLFSATVRENIMMGNPAAKRETVDSLMEQFGVLPLAGRMISEHTELSGGEKQKISIIRALVKNAGFLILDEPTNHLDQKSIEALKRCIQGTDKTVVTVTHDVSLQEGMEKQLQV